MTREGRRQATARGRLRSLFRRSASHLVMFCATAGVFSPMPMPVFSYLPTEPDEPERDEPERDYVPAAPLSRRERRAWARLCQDLAMLAGPGEPPARRGPFR